jgi:hypothetical protein
MENQPMQSDPLPPLKWATIYRDGNSWMLDHADDPSAADVKHLFGTTVLPMPFTARAEEAMVLAALTAQNPGVIITRGEDRNCSCPDCAQRRTR